MFKAPKSSGANLENLAVVRELIWAAVKAAACEKVSETHLKLTLTEGKYHQVKRMIAAVGNRVEGLHRSRIGSLLLPPELAPGQWRWLTAQDLHSISSPNATLKH